MTTPTARIAWLTLGVALLTLLLAGGAEAMPKCLVCHGKRTLARTTPSGRLISLYVDEAQLKASVHGGRACTDCHSDITAIPHNPWRQVLPSTVFDVRASRESDGHQRGGARCSGS